MTFPTTPEGWAIRLSQVVKIFHQTHELPRFPIKVASLAKEFSKQLFPNEPITMISGDELTDGIEGMLFPKPDESGEWGIIFNSSPTISKGRINFTLGHELGHYLLHRKRSPEGFKCTMRNMMDWDSEVGRMEAEANKFASYLLMPLDDFREQIKGQKVSMELMLFLAARYEVSVTAAILKWLEFTPKRAMLVFGKSGFIDWAWSSTPLIKSGIFYRARQETIQLPEKSLAAKGAAYSEFPEGIKHPGGVWAGNETVHETTIFSPQKEMSISLLIYPDYSSHNLYKNSAEFKKRREFDTFDKFKTNS
ncbi:MAG: ImmA/IrrE family metallo-endopeptidase [Rhizobiales bacterium]|nr:ImmA/IrrE family metallo-endopeptidase [Hyphomicrobiales bacterium]